ncbi:carboxypeptidase-like regulatory domain-containing protein, partial [Pedobacter sp.]|uniref:carboxypeptidase-like regulatory domain-containing protein n=1 Tax=Pedobacter sp. TaxID=1411316 RepID=UPI002B659FE1
MNQKFTKIKAFLTVVCILLSSVLLAQTRKISGKVLAEKEKISLPGISVLLKGTKTGTITNSSGEFAIQAAKGDVLIFSSIGYLSKEVTIGESSVLQVFLLDDNAKLDEVVVVGYGQQSRRNVTGAVARLDSKVLDAAPRSNIGTALQGAISGLS